uniref:Crinkler effector protein N-terminal domain-containing protein n=1 Tax=Globisporangium ultimum (strain ATCC 200006 / CBS 805.95 / DAOM BR144) TaxID=431595 RepID=K3XBH8_GLOUD
MVKLVCVVVGEEGSAFPVDIEPTQLVGDLKDAIQKKKPNRIKCDADELQLFLAKGDAWLPSNDPDVVAMRSGETPKKVKDLLDVEIDPADEIGDLFACAPTKKVIHCVDVGDLPQEGEFLKLFKWTDDDCGTVMDIKVIDDIVHFTGSKFYMRKEILCVLENFKNIYQNEFDTGEMVNKQFILMGSPGTGKSCILALLCFFIAIKEERPVVWFRQANTTMER